MQIKMKFDFGKDKKAFNQRDVERFQDFYWKKFRVKLSRKDAERILFCHKFDYRGPQGPFKR